MSEQGIFRHGEVYSEYERWRSTIPSKDMGHGGLTVHDVLKVHFLVVDMFYGQKSGIGGIGPKDVGLLESAVSRQYSSFGDHVRWERTEDKAATLLFGVVKNHPFHDANKRTAFLSVLYLLRRNGIVLSVTEQQFEDFVVLIADDSYRKKEKFIRSFSEQEDGEIKFISHIIKKTTRQLDNKDKLITYRELDRILHRFGFGLFYPENNYIDVCTVQDGIVGDRICRIGFPGWTKQILKQNLRYLRQETGLDALNGVDSEAFFGAAEPVSVLMARYYDPLVRLADR